MHVCGVYLALPGVVARVFYRDHLKNTAQFFSLILIGYLVSTEKFESRYSSRSAIFHLS